MDNASFHHSVRIEQMCYNAGVKILYLPPYSPDLNPIEEYFAELKAFIKRNWHVYEADPSQALITFLNGASTWLGERRKVPRAILDTQD
jgi:transposase